MEDYLKRLRIENILKENPDATVGDFKDGRYVPKEKKIHEKSEKIKEEENRILELLRQSIEKEMREHEKLLGMSYATIPGVEDAKKQDIQKQLSEKTQKIHKIDMLVKELEAQYADLDAEKDEVERKYRGLNVEVIILKILKEAKDMRFPDEEAQQKFDDLQSMLDLSVTNYFKYKKEKDLLEKMITDAKLELDGQADIILDNNGEKKSFDVIKEEIRVLQVRMNEEQKNKFAAVIELKKIMDIHNLDAN